MLSTPSLEARNLARLRRAVVEKHREKMGDYISAHLIWPLLLYPVYEVKIKKLKREEAQP